jgi:hypothetical protein
MPLLSRLEKALERLAEGGAERVFGGRLDLVAVGQALCNAGLEASRSVAGALEAPSTYDIHLALSDYGRLVDVIEALEERYAQAAWHRFREMGYDLAAVPWVLITRREGLEAGRFEVQARFAPRTPTCVLWEADGEGQPRRFLLPAIIGRDADCDLVIEDAGVSRRHAEISWNRNHFSAVDLDSKNGTFLNGRRLTRGPIEPGHTLLVGPRAFCFGLDRDPGA